MRRIIIKVVITTTDKIDITLQSSLEKYQCITIKLGCTKLRCYKNSILMRKKYNWSITLYTTYL